MLEPMCRIAVRRDGAKRAAIGTSISLQLVVRDNRASVVSSRIELESNRCCAGAATSGSRWC